MNAKEAAALALASTRTPGASTLISPTGWRDLVPDGAWSAVAGSKPQAKINADGTVLLRGRLDGGALGDLADIIQTGFHPTRDLVLAVATSDESGPVVPAPGTISITTAGQVALLSAAPAVTDVWLDGASYSTLPVV